MKKDYRVKKSYDFEKIIHKRKSVANGVFVLYYLPNKDHLRIGISVSKKLGKAHIRNKIKRQVRMMAQNTFPKEMACDYIIIVRKKYLLNNYETNHQKLNDLFHKTVKRMEK